MTLSFYVYNVAVGGKIPLDNYHILSGKVKTYLFFLWWAFSAPTLWNTLQLFHSSLSRLSVPPRRISSKTHPITHGENGMRTMEPLYKDTPKMRTLVLIRTQCPSYIHTCMYVRTCRIVRLPLWNVDTSFNPDTKLSCSKGVLLWYLCVLFLNNYFVCM